jgi:tripartite ATP-independent transporter DctM subunit
LDADLIAIGGFVVLFALATLRIPIGVAMGIVGVGGFAMIVGLEPALRQLSLSALRSASSETFGLVPMFLLMGSIATASGMSAELFRAANAWLGHRRGGLATATIAACGGFAAICGSSVATAVTMTRVALPEMRGRGYSDAVATGTIAAGGTLGILIPPSIVLAIYGIITEQDIGRLFIAGVLPGLLSVLLFMLTINVIGWLAPDTMPASGTRADWATRMRTLGGVWAIGLLFIFVIGGIYIGLFTPTEAAGAGAAGAFIISVARRRLSFDALVGCLVEAIRTTASVFIILIGAVMFGYFLAVTQTTQKLTASLIELGLGPYPTLGLILLLYFVLGCVLDALAMVVLTVPILLPVILELGFDPIWFGVIVVVAAELALITPPVGMNVFVINSVVREISLVTIFRGALPFVVTETVVLVLLIVFPAIVLFLPSRM